MFKRLWLKEKIYNRNDLLDSLKHEKGISIPSYRILVCLALDSYFYNMNKHAIGWDLEANPENVTKDISPLIANLLNFIRKFEDRDFEVFNNNIFLSLYPFLCETGVSAEDDLYGLLLVDSSEGSSPLVLYPERNGNRRSNRILAFRKSVEEIDSKVKDVSLIIASSTTVNSIQKKKSFENIISYVRAA